MKTTFSNIKKSTPAPTLQNFDGISALYSHVINKNSTTFLQVGLTQQLNQDNLQFQQRLISTWLY